MSTKTLPLFSIFFLLASTIDLQAQKVDWYTDFHHKTYMLQDYNDFVKKSEKAITNYIVFNDSTFSLFLNSTTCKGRFTKNEKELVLGRVLGCSEQCCSTDEAKSLHSFFTGTIKHSKDEKGNLILSSFGKKIVLRKQQATFPSSTYQIKYSKNIKGIKFHVEESILVHFYATHVTFSIQNNKCQQAIIYSTSSLHFIQEASSCLEKYCSKKSSIELLKSLNSNFKFKRVMPADEIIIFANDKEIYLQLYTGNEQDD